MADAGRTPISGCVISYQEADRIADCVRSLQLFCDEVVVVDSGSTDGTVAIAEELGARIVHNQPFPGHREQKQFAIEQAQHDLVFCLDADERATPELVAAVKRLQTTGVTAHGYEMPRKNHYLGRILRFGLHVPDRKLRLFDRRKGRWGGRNPHDRVVMDRGSRVVRLPEAIEHLSYRDFAHHKRTIESFTRIAVDAMLQEGRTGNILDVLFRPPAVFFKSLLLKLGFLDGWRGFVVAGMAAYTDWKKYWRLIHMPPKPKAAANGKESADGK